MSLPHLQRPHYQAADPGQTPQPAPIPRPVVPQQQKVSTESLPRPMSRQDEHLGVYTTLGQTPPPPDSLFTVKEQGLTTPKLLRLSMNSIPLDSSTCSNLGLPLAAVWQPLAELPEDDDQIAKIEAAPFRCSRCFAYVNSFFKFIDGGRRCVCNICGIAVDSPEIYGRDRASKPELFAGTYDFKAPADYSNRPVQMPLYLFCVDVSAPSMQLGLPQQVFSSIRAIIDYIPQPDRCLVGIITFDSSIQIFKVSNTGELSETIMTDVEDPFIPEPVAGCCYNLATQKETLENLLNKLVEYNFSNPSKQTLSPGAVVYAIKEHMLKNRGGRVMIFTSQLGVIGKHSLQAKAEVKPVHSEKEKAYLPAENYLTLGGECCVEDICVDMFVCTHQGVNVGSLAAMCSQTGGDLYYFQGFKPEIDAERLYYQLTRILTRPQFSQIAMRARCSNGLSIDYYIGKYKRKGPVEMEVACIDSDKSITVVMKYDETLKEGVDYYIQCAMLYTNAAGERLIRICNGKMFATKSVPNILKAADPDVVSNVMMKISAYSIFEQPLNTIRENWHSSIIKLLVAHRQAIGDNDFSKILVPETLKLVPLYCNTALKLLGLTLANTSLDSRLASIYQILGLPIHNSRLLIYPKLYALHDISTQTHQPGTYSANEILILPRLIGNSREYIKSDGVYLFNNGEILLIYIGKDANPEFLGNVWGIYSAEELFSNSDYWQLRDLENEDSQKVLAIVEEVRRRNPSAYASVFYFFEGFSQDDNLLRKLLVEDNTASELAYGDFLMRLHKVVLNKISRKD